MRDWIDSKGRLHRFVGVRDGRACWWVAVPALARAMFVPALLESGGGDSGTWYTSTNDGFILSYHATYSTARDTGANLAVYNADEYLVVGQMLMSGSRYVYRGLLPFNTSDLPADAILEDGCSVGLYGKSDQSGTDFNVTVVAYSGGSPLTTADWGKFGSTSGGLVSTSGFKVDGYNVITLNATGRGLINRGGITLLGLRSSDDIGNTEPTDTSVVHIWTAEAEGTGKDPYLYIVYSMPTPEASELLPPDAYVSIARSVTLSALYTQYEEDSGTLRFQADRVNTFNSGDLVVDTADVNSGARGQVTLSLPDRGTWYWRVRAESGVYNSDWSATRTIERVACAAEAISPASNADCTVTPQPFVVAAYSDDETQLSVHLQIDTVATFNGVNLVELASDPADSGAEHIFHHPMLGSQPWYWRARAEQVQ